MRVHHLPLLLALFLAPGVPGAEPTVRVVFFYSPTCPHCHEVLGEDLPRLLERHGESLVVMGINVTSVEGARLFRAVMDHFGVPEAERGVPAVVLGQRLLLGSVDISRELPGAIVAGLAAGGTGWPALAGLDEALSARERVAPVAGPGAAGFAAEDGVLQRFARDPVGNGLSVAVLVGMLAAIVLTGWRLLRPVPPRSWPTWRFYALIGAGLCVAGYLSFVEVGGRTAICGPVGDCNTVQQSPYARLLGIPVAVLGLAGYGLLLLLTLLHDRGTDALRRAAALARLAVTLAGTALSAYFTFLEPFVIGATCLWCLASAVIMTLLLWAATPPASAVLRPDPGDQNNPKLRRSQPVVPSSR